LSVEVKELGVAKVNVNLVRLLEKNKIAHPVSLWHNGIPPSPSLPHLTLLQHQFHQSIGLLESGAPRLGHGQVQAPVQLLQLQHIIKYNTTQLSLSPSLPPSLPKFRTSHAENPGEGREGTLATGWMEGGKEWKKYLLAHIKFKATVVAAAMLM